MKNFQQNLLILFALALCGLCAWQWYVQTLLHGEGEKLQTTIFKQASEIEGYTNTIKNMDAEIAGLSTHVNELKQTVTTNQQAALAQKKEIGRLENTGLALSNEIVQYKDIVEKLEAKLKEASDGITKQNAVIQDVAAQRDDAVKKYNDSVKDRNALVEKYNALVERINKLQAAATNAPGK